MKNNIFCGLYIRKCISVMVFILFPFFISCKSDSFGLYDSVPYVLSGDFVMEENSTDYSICGVDFSLLNKSEKEIKRVSIVFYLFDQDGEPAYECQNKVSVQIDKSISSGEVSCFCMSLDRFMNSIPENNLTVDYLFLSRIEYEDGSHWEDPYGLVAFR